MRDLRGADCWRSEFTDCTSVRPLTWLLSALIAVSLAACAAHPVPPPAPPPVVVTKPGPATAPGTNGQEPVINAKLLRQGYRAKVTNGQVLYCRSEQVTGSQFRSTTCMTEDQLLTRDRNTDTFKEGMGRDFGNTCVGPGCQ